ncbi:[protein-PII] uridylyltransferase [Nocardioides limicola]|uniref:[protein-PII] uridylyltransferase n=1 Tax=Nocardioides limicola TaxID=2803368 RepID=UPI00193C175E|nr:[protein-PII] uridylyltransferase [Nocardioides sp. DJM-14]
MSAADREQRTEAADELCAAAFAGVAAPDSGVALVAVGGYGRRELAPYSDLDLVLVHADDVEPGDWATALWYPLWDSGHKIDHAVRSLTGTIEAADEDLKVALGLLDARHVAGDPNLTLQLRTAVLGRWRRHARDRLPRLHELVLNRHRLAGELAHESVPDIKEAEGGLRDAGVLRALVATWLVDVPHQEMERSRQALLDFRDQMHEHAGRAGDRVAPEMWPELAERLGFDDVVAVQMHVRRAGRRLTHLSRLTWQRVDRLTERRATLRGSRRPALEPIAPGVALSRGEVVLDKGAPVAGDPLLLLRAAAEAAERGAVLAPATVSRLVRDGARLPEPWPAEARQLLVRLLAAGRSLLPVWETLEETGATDLILPEWERIRLLPHASAIHRFTVDRHVVETCIEASALIRRVARPDVLLVAALLHDIGKGDLTEHSIAGEPIAREVAARIGFDAEEADLIGTLVRWHLLLGEVATTRDPDDPATIEHVVARLGTAEAASLLLALTEADARSASAKAWSSWRAGLVRQVGTRAHAALLARAAGASAPRIAEPEMVIPAAVLADPGAVHVGVEATGDGSRVLVVSGDRVGLLADAAAMLAVLRIGIRAARAWTQGQYGLSVWEVAEQHLDPGALHDRLSGIAAGRVDVSRRLARRAPSRLEPTVQIRPGASATATVLEVRMDDRQGVVHLVCSVLAGLGMSVRSAHVSTLGPQAVDVFYVQEEGAGILSEERAAEAAHAVREAVSALVETG